MAVHGHQRNKYGKDIKKRLSYGHFPFFQNGGRPPSWISLQVKNTSRTLRTVHVYHRTKFGNNSSNGGRVIAIFRCPKWRSAAILDFVVAQR